MERVSLNAISFEQNSLLSAEYGKGGMATAKKLLKINQISRNIWLSDTFEGMTDFSDENDIEVVVKELLVNTLVIVKMLPWAYAFLEKLK